ncbi:MAG: hypothetical protein CVV64_15005 [Candidatus Wallbacteria bacterium HGW-Wallbacteria-1]|uniref:Uncharacterized protein n=1 Tax=Candidatus Wallbacteria bacterium HGW-Wallbacteria-1 TaxID=2013854 RepID=A0A2N1PLU0_9BACT|nr:MAG: hypothetical protein CVV64_15005 [Candidatus Wallbacteria bacterium HGW-Wallbacteria-1]
MEMNRVKMALKLVLFKIIGNVTALMLMIIVLAAGNNPVSALPGGLPDPEPGLSEVTEKALFGTVDFSALLIFHPAMGDFDPAYGAFLRSLPADSAEAAQVREQRMSRLKEVTVRSLKDREALDRRLNAIEERRSQARKTLEMQLLEARRVYMARRAGKNPDGVRINVNGGTASVDKGESSDDTQAMSPGPASLYAQAVNEANLVYQRTQTQLERESDDVGIEMARSSSAVMDIFYTSREETARKLMEIARECSQAVLRVKRDLGLMGVFNFTPSRLENYIDPFVRTPQARARDFNQRFSDRVKALGEKGKPSNLLAQFMDKPLEQGNSPHGPVAETATMLWEWFYGLSDMRKAAASMAGSEMLLFGGVDITAEALTAMMERRGVPREKIAMVREFMKSLP